MNSTEQIFKSEIHVHLEATITPDLCRKFAKRNNVNLSEDLFGTKYAYEWDDFYDFIKGGFEFDMAHIDISNTGEIIEKVIKAYPDKTILFEGGSKERDIIDWMVKYKAKPLNYIQKEILNNNFPSISLIKK